MFFFLRTRHSFACEFYRNTKHLTKRDTPLNRNQLYIHTAKIYMFIFQTSYDVFSWTEHAPDWFVLGVGVCLWMHLLLVVFSLLQMLLHSYMNIFIFRWVTELYTTGGSCRLYSIGLGAQELLLISEPQPINTEFKHRRRLPVAYSHGLCAWWLCLIMLIQKKHYIHSWYT